MTLLKIIEIVVCVILVVFALLAIESKKLINAILYLSILSMFAVVGFILLQAPDVAITEAVIGSGLVTAIFIFTLAGVKNLKAKEQGSIGSEKDKVGPDKGKVGERI